MKNLFFYLTAICFYCSTLNAQKVQWASNVINFSSQLEETTYSAIQIIGEPNSMSSKGRSGTAWTSKDDTRKETLHVGFKEPMKIEQVVVAENYNPGGVCKVSLFDKDGVEYIVYKQKADTLNIQNRLFSVKFDKTTYDVYSVKVLIDCRVTPGENQIDAIGISDSKDDIIVNTDVKTADVSFFSKAEKLDNNVNSEYSEVNPKISPDGKTLYVNRKNYPPNYDDDEIWYSNLINDKWSKLQNIGSPLNNSHHNALESITPDGNTALLINQYFKETGATNSGCSVTRRTIDGWSFPDNLKIINLINRDRYTGFYLANDGKTIVTQLRRDDTKGESDLYVTFLQKDGSWSEPLRLGDNINSMGGECTPFLASDNKTLYFSSDGLGGYGSNDIFVSRRLDDTWQNWSKPLNIGSAVNDEGWDAYYSIPASGDYAYFVKNSDIYRIKLNEEIKPNPVALISGTVYNQKTMQSISDAVISYEYLSDGKEAGIAHTNPKNGEYKIVLPYGYNYGFMASAKGFFAVSDNLDMTDLKEYKEITRSLYLVPIEVGQTVRLNNIFFDFAKFSLREESFPELNRVVDFLSKNQAVEIEISGHTDNVGNDDTNFKLSEARAQAIKDYLIKSGISQNRITSKGYGKTKPVASNETDEGRQFNRRVEFTITKFN